jgi:hypothetical protein
MIRSLQMGRHQILQYEYVIDMSGEMSQTEKGFAHLTMSTHNIIPFTEFHIRWIIRF